MHIFFMCIFATHAAYCRKTLDRRAYLSANVALRPVDQCLISLAPFTQPVQGGNVAPLLSLTVLYKMHKDRMEGGVGFVVPLLSRQQR